MELTLYFKKTDTEEGMEAQEGGDICVLLLLLSRWIALLYSRNKGPSSQGYGFSSGHVWMWELDCEEG